MKVFRSWKRLLVAALLALSFSAAPLMSAICSAYNSCGGSCSVQAPVVSCHYGYVAICMGYNTSGQVISHYYVSCGPGGITMP